MMFREVLAATVNELRATAVLSTQHEVTIVRDVEGRIRLVIGTRAPALAPLPDAATQQRLSTALAARLGPWLATPAEPGQLPRIWLDDRAAARRPPERLAIHLALDTVRQHRVPAPWERQPNDPEWFLLERHAAKRAWVGEVQPAPPWGIADVDGRLRPPVVTFFSHKGGVGRTTALVAVALHLARANRKVAVVDLDIEAPGLASLLLQGEPQAGALDYLMEVSPAAGTIQQVTTPVAGAALVGAGEDIQLVAAGPVDDAFLEMLARLDLQDAAASRALAQRIRQLFLDLQGAFGPFDFILVDARAGLHEVAGLMLAGLSHGAVVVGTDSPQSWMGVRQVARLLSAPYLRNGQDPRPLLLVHGMAPPPTDSRYAQETQSFLTTAYNTLSDHYYPRDALPGVQEPDRPHSPVVIPWTAELRGGGGLLTEPVVDLLMAMPYRRLTERLVRLFGRTLEEQTTP